MSTHKVLVIDDDPAVVRFLAVAVSAEGYTVETATNGYAGLLLARRWHPHVVVLDLRMPEVDGITLCWALRTDSATATIPIIALSAHDLARLDTPLLPVEARLPKPFDLTALYRAIARCCVAQ